MAAEAGLFSLAGRTALVTGGGSGLGRAIAHALSDAGAAIVLAGRREGVLTDALGGRDGATLAVDLTAEGAVADVRAALDARALSPDILVNAAGINLREPAERVSPESWRRTIELNLSVPFFLAQALVPAMAARGWGRVVNIASLQSARAMPNGIAYGASKGGIAQLTRAMAEAWSRHGVTANALAPGFFPTDLTAPVFADEAATADLARRTAIGRNGALPDIAGPAVFLASEASAYVTGQILYVDGGFTAK
jgi:NAD(P)-dependent dehydrogenase (short-subunit alcohol dehydrogenase family)